MKSFKELAVSAVNTCPVGKYLNKSWNDIALTDPRYVLWAVAETNLTIPYSAIRLALKETIFKKPEKPCFFPMEDVPF